MYISLHKYMYRIWERCYFWMTWMNNPLCIFFCNVGKLHTPWSRNQSILLCPSLKKGAYCFEPVSRSVPSNVPSISLDPFAWKSRSNFWSSYWHCPLNILWILSIYATLLNFAPCRGTFMFHCLKHFLLFIYWLSYTGNMSKIHYRVDYWY